MVTKEYKSYYVSHEMRCNGEYIRFQNGLFKTDREDFQKTIESDPNFGIKIIILKEEKAKEVDESDDKTEESETSEQPRRRGNPNFVKKGE